MPDSIYILYSIGLDYEDRSAAHCAGSFDCMDRLARSCNDICSDWSEWKSRHQDKEPDQDHLDDWIKWDNKANRKRASVVRALNKLMGLRRKIDQIDPNYFDVSNFDVSNFFVTSVPLQSDESPTR